MRTALEVLGWIGSITVVVSLVLPNQIKFRSYNLLGSFIATVYNAALAIWPFVLMNAAIVIIDAYWLRRLRIEARAKTAAD